MEVAAAVAAAAIRIEALYDVVTKAAPTAVSVMLPLK